MSDKFNPSKPKAGYYKSLPMHDYQEANAISNSGLLLIERNPADFKWSKDAPKDPSKSGTSDFGTASHTALIEPEKFDESVLIGPTKSRDSKGFTEFEREHGAGKIVLLENEETQIRIMKASANAHPTMAKFLSIDSDVEPSIFVLDKDREIMRKIRPDLDLHKGGFPLLCDVKTTADISAWRSPLRWKNPLFEFNYGHTAAYYMDTASIHYGKQIDEYSFLLLQKNIEMGRYPVSVFTITREELEQYGFFDRVNNNLDRYAECLHSNNWFGVERFPIFK